MNAPGGRVNTWELAADGSRVFHDSSDPITGKAELCDSPLDGSQATRLLTPPFAAGRGVRAGFRLHPDQSRLLYLADQDTSEKYELYSVPTDGSRVSTRLSGPMIDAGDVQADHRWSPDGTRIVYRADAVLDSVYYLYSRPADGSGAPVQLYPGQVNEPAGDSFDVAPDSSRVLFESNDDLFSAPLDGSAPAVQLSSLEFVGLRTITPDSRQVVFEGGYHYLAPSSEEEIARGLYVVPLDGSGPAVELIAPIEASPSFAPPVIQLASDSEHALFLSVIASQLLSARTDGLAPSELLNDFPFANMVFSFALSPDGSQVVFAARGNGSTGLYRTPVDGSGLPVALVLAPSTDVLAPFQVTATGHVVYGRSGSEKAIYVVPLDGSSAPLRLNDPLGAGGGIGTGQRTVWLSPDERWLVYAAYQDATRLTELFSTTLDGTVPVRKVSGPIVTGGDVGFVRFVPGSRRLVYDADQEVDNRPELFLSSYGRTPWHSDSLHDPVPEVRRRMGPPAGRSRSDQHDLDPADRTWP